MSGFKGKCAPFVYVAECPTKQKDAYMVAARVWLVLNSVAFLAVLISFIRRLWIVRERFNTLRLVMIKFLIGLPLHIIYDATRAFSANAFGAPIEITSFLQTIGWVPLVTVMILLTITWMTFSSKNLLIRPAITGNWVLYLGFVIPYVISSIVATTLAGINYSWYFVAFRFVLASWSAMLLILFALCFYYGRKSLNRLKATGDKFAKNQQLRAFVLIAFIFLSCGIVLGVHALLLDTIDKSLTWFLIITTFYRTCAWSLLVGGAIYTWVATSRWITHPPKPTTMTVSRSTSKSQGSASLNATATDTPRSPRSGSAHPDSTSSSSSSSSSELHPSAKEAKEGQEVFGQGNAAVSTELAPLRGKQPAATSSTPSAASDDSDSANSVDHDSSETPQETDQMV